VPPKKSRTPPPPRRPQGPRQRTDSRTADAERRNRLILYGFAGTGVVGLLVVLALFAFTGGSSANSVKKAMNEAGCTFKTYKAQPRTRHLTKDPPDKPFKYNSFPPSSGRHYFETLTYNFYNEPVDKYRLVHNLEHGAVVVQWGSKVPRAQIDKIRSWWQNDPRGIVLAPLPALGDKIAEVAWTHVATCTRFDDGAFSKFRDTFQFKGPERIPPESMDPGAS